jgi:predicted secreted protein
MEETQFKQAIIDAYNQGYRDAELDYTGCESNRDISEEPNADIHYSKIIMNIV